MRLLLLFFFSKLNQLKLRPYPFYMETFYFETLATTQQPIPKTLILATMDHTYYNSPYYTPVNNHYYWEPQPPPNIYIHPELPAGLLGYTPEQLMPILCEQQQFLQDKFAQPLPTLTRPTTTYHLRAWAEPQPNPTLLSPQQEATQLGITPEELAMISEDSIRKQVEWIAKDEAEWREHKEKRWWGEVREDREIGEWENWERAEVAEPQERDKTTQENTTTASPRFAPPPPVHPESATAQLELTPEEAQAIHEECLRAQEELHREMDQDYHITRERWIKRDVHQPTPQAYEMPNETHQATSSLGGDSINRRDTLYQVVRHRLPTPTAHPELEQGTYVGHGTAYEPPMVATPYDDDDIAMSNHGDTPLGGCQPQLPNPILDTQTPLQLPDHDRYTMSDHGPHTTLFEDHKYKGSNTPMEPDHNVVIEQLTHKLFTSGNTDASWAEEMEMEMALEPQGEYIQAGYLDPTPAPPPPAPWYPPQSPTLDYPPPQTHYLPPHQWYKPPDTHHQPRCAL
jgi:hypothetical protein